MSATQSVIDQAIDRLRSAGVASPEADVWSLVASVLGISRGEAQARALIDQNVLSATQLAQFENWVSRREAREPLWHITGRAPFMTLELEVGPGVFNPRPETELLAQQAIADAQLMVPAGDVLDVVDLCAGSGAIGLAIASQVTHARVLLVEASEAAGEYLLRNVDAIAPSTEVVLGDLGEARDHRAIASVDLVVSNPPYLIAGVEPLDRETQEFDPPEALFASAEGFADIERVIAEAAWLLRPGGVVLIEHGIGQGDQTREALVAAGFRQAETQQDLLGRDRFSRAVAATR